MTTPQNDEFDFECRFSDVTDSGEIEGVAVRFETVDSYRTTFAPEAFKGVTKVPMLWSHRSDEVLGKWTSFEVRDGGLTARGQLNLELAKAREVRAMLKAGDISGLSIGFNTVKDERAANGIRRITEARLHEISIVAFPSVPGSGVTRVRSGENTGTEGAAAFVAACKAAALSLKGN